VFARFPFTHFSVTFGRSGVVPSFALALKIHALAVLDCAFLIAHLASALAILPFTLQTLTVGALAIHALAILLFAVQTLAVLALVILALALLALLVILQALLGLLALAPPSLLVVRPRGQHCCKAEKDSRRCDPVSHDILLGCVLYGRAWP
jgi:hypothetical protein